MASTSTNKQPLLGDRPLHITKDLRDKFVLSTSNGLEPGGNSALLIVNCTSNDGALIDSAAGIARPTSQGYEIFMYLSPASDALRPDEAEFVGNWVVTEYDEATDTEITPVKALTRAEYADFPELLRPTAKLGSVNGAGQKVEPTYYRGLYIPKGKNLWAACKQKSSSDSTAEAPFIQVQGVYF